MACSIVVEGIKGSGGAILGIRFRVKLRLKVLNALLQATSLLASEAYDGGLLGYPSTSILVFPEHRTQNDFQEGLD
jgi:hypothetical protein